MQVFLWSDSIYIMLSHVLAHLSSIFSSPLGNAGKEVPMFEQPPLQDILSLTFFPHRAREL